MLPIQTNRFQVVSYAYIKLYKIDDAAGLLKQDNVGEQKGIRHKAFGYIIVEAKINVLFKVFIHFLFILILNH